MQRASDDEEVVLGGCCIYTAALKRKISEPAQALKRDLVYS